MLFLFLGEEKREKHDLFYAALPKDSPRQSGGYKACLDRDILE
jgi:hypothetical protein